MLRLNAIQISALQSWGPELRHFAKLEKKVESGGEMCDLWIDTPTYIMKIDASK